MTINYEDIVLKVFLSSEIRQDIEGYFFRECKKAVINFYKPEEFFDGCLRVINNFESKLEIEAQKIKKKLDNNLETIIRSLPDLDEHNINENEKLEKERVDKKVKAKLKMFEWEFIEKGKANAYINLPENENGESVKLNFNKIKIIKASIFLAQNKINNDVKPSYSNFKINKNATGYFCFLINESGINKKLNDESVHNYCQRICYEFKLEYSDQVRQNFKVDINPSDLKNKKHNLIENIIPKLEPEYQEKLKRHLNIV